MNSHAKMITAIAVIATVFSVASSAAELTGAGSTFVYPILSKWAAVYKTETGTAVNYQSIGSGGGIKQIQSKTVDFGATDMPLKTEDLAKDDLVQFPVINGAIVPVVHITGVATDQLKLTGELLSQIFLGKIKKWNDPAIVAVNSGVTLPDQAISVVHRSDGSGTTFVFTNYLSKVSDDWKSKAGEGSSVNWPTGVGGKGNEGVASYVKQIDGAIGYVEYAYALQNDMPVASLKNQAGSFVTAKIESFQAAAAGADWSKAPSYYLILTNAPGKNSWPIAGSTFILMHKKSANAAQASETVKFFTWVFAHGDKMAKELHYVPLPPAVTKMIEKTWKDEVKTADNSAAARN
jgi:phosphate transport system substrate-binding protein